MQPRIFFVRILPEFLRSMDNFGGCTFANLIGGHNSCRGNANWLATYLETELAGIIDGMLSLMKEFGFATYLMLAKLI